MKNNYLRTACLFVTLGVSSTTSFAQREVSLENSGNVTDGGPLSTRRYENVTGNPYLMEDWNTAMVKFVNGTTLKEVKVKYDLVAEVLVFENKGRELLFIDPVEEFKINLSQKGDHVHFKRLKSFKNNGFYQVLFEGTTSLYKKHKKIIVDKTPFNSATTVKLVESKVSYHLYIKNKAVSVKNTEKSILSVLNDKKVELANYLQKEALNLQDDKDLIKLIAYYNTL